MNCVLEQTVRFYPLAAGGDLLIAVWVTGRLLSVA